MRDPVHTLIIVFGILFVVMSLGAGLIWLERRLLA